MNRAENKVKAVRVHRVINDLGDTWSSSNSVSDQTG
tara:strand:- start:153 stop:260 length:108 start_codon:yes stop_codon:yes gene_type:complete